MTRKQVSPNSLEPYPPPPPPQKPKALRPKRTLFVRLRRFSAECAPFLRFTLCQAVSILLSSICGWVLSIRVLQDSDSSFAYTLTVLALTAPGFVLAPLCGWVADHFDRKKVIAIADSGALCCSLAIALSVQRLDGELRLHHVLIANLVNGACSAFQSPAVLASLPDLVPPQHRESAVVLREISSALVDALTPLLGGVLSGVVPVRRLVWIDLAGYLVGCIALLMTPFPPPSASPDSAIIMDAADKKSITTTLRDMLAGVRYLTKDRPAVGCLALAVMLGRFCLSLVGQALPAFMLSFATVAEMGFSMTFAISGIVVGSAVVGALHISRWPTRVVCAGLALQSILIQCMPQSILRVAVLGFLFMACVPAVMTPVELILTTCVEPWLVGRVSAVISAAGSAANFAGVLLSGPLLDCIFKPLLASPDTAPLVLQRLVGGTGQGKGTMLFFCTVGVAEFLCMTSLAFSKTFRSLDSLVFQRTITPSPPALLSTQLTPHT